MIAKTPLASALVLSLTVSAFAGASGTLTPGPELGDGVPGLVVVAALVGAFFVFRQLRRRRAD
jgi:hypothetical protein